MNDEGARQDAHATSHQITCPNCTDVLGERYPRCACGERFPGVKQLERHIRKTGCLGEREYHRLIRPRVRWQR